MADWLLTLCRLCLFLLGLLGNPMGFVCLPVHLEAPCSDASNVRCTKSLVATASLTQHQQLQKFLGGRLSIRNRVDTVGFCRSAAVEGSAFNPWRAGIKDIHQSTTTGTGRIQKKSSGRSNLVHFLRFPFFCAFPALFF
jgi:hypothetical protein